MKELIISNYDEVIPLVIEKEYSNFIDFLNNEKYKIYQKILRSFEETVTAKDNNKKLLIIAKVEGTTFDTVFLINKDNLKLLSETVNSYFESIEDYESCGRIHKLCLKIKDN